MFEIVDGRTTDGRRSDWYTISSPMLGFIQIIVLNNKIARLISQKRYSVGVQLQPLIEHCKNCGLYLGSIGMDCVINEPCYKVTIFTKTSFSYNSFVKFGFKKNWEPHDIINPNPC